MRIGITINLGTSLWSNGINQNAIYLARVFQKLDFKVDLIYDGNNIGKAADQAKKVYKDTVSLHDSLKKKYDVIITLGFAISKKTVDYWKIRNKDLKLVQYKCGNDFLVDTESLLFGAHDARDGQNSIESLQSMAKPDQIWLIPQMENTNYYYYQFLSNQTSATVVPFIWDPIFIETEAAAIGLLSYEKRSTKRIGVLEPNMNVFKHVLMPFVITSKYVKDGGSLEAFHTFSTDKKKDAIIFKKAVHLSDFKNNNVMITANGRQPLPHVLQNHIDIILSWQWENPLNYLYLDAAWLGFPVVHNAHLCKDIGYYYEGFDADMGANAIKSAIELHNDDTEYLTRMRSIISRYTIENDKLINNYKMLIENVLANNFERYRYEWQTNTIS